VNASNRHVHVEAPLPVRVHDPVHEEWQHVRRVLAVRLDNLGDVLVATPAIHAIRESLPGAEITLLASPVGAQVGRLNPDVDDVLVYSAPWMDPWSHLPLDPAREMRTIAQLSAGRYDAAVIFSSFRQSPLPAAYLCYLAGIPLRLAASIDGPGSLLTTRHRHPERMMHEVERGLDMVAAVGMRTSDDRLVLRVPDGAHEEIADLVSGQRPLVVVHPGCSMPARTYPWEQYVEVIDSLVRGLGARVVLTGAADERPLVETILAHVTPWTRGQVRAAAGSLAFPAFCATAASARRHMTACARCTRGRWFGQWRTC
jgi:ADP-heptose:LPS heptosyltransferase